MEDDASSSIVDEEAPCQNAPDCKFGSKAVRKIKAKSKTAKPIGSKGKDSAPPLARPVARPSADKGKDVAPPSPKNRSKEEGVGGGMETCDEERTL